MSGASRESDASGPIVAMLGRGEVREAIILMELLLSNDPDNTAMLYNLGMAYSDTGALDRSIVVLRRLLALEPANTNTRVALGVALTRQEKYEQALVELQRAVSEAPTILGHSATWALACLSCGKRSRPSSRCARRLN